MLKMIRFIYNLVGKVGNEERFLSFWSKRCQVEFASRVGLRFSTLIGATSNRICHGYLLQYTDWDRINDGYENQKAIADIVGDYFFICPSTHFSQVFADRGMKVYYYFFTQVSWLFSCSAHQRILVNLTSSNPDPRKNVFIIYFRVQYILH